MSLEKNLPQDSKRGKSLKSVYEDSVTILSKCEKDIMTKNPYGPNGFHEHS